MFLESRPVPSVALRPVSPKDADLLWRWRGEWSVRRFQPLHDLTPAQLRTELTQQRIGDLYQGRGGKFQWIVSSEGRPAGWITLVVNNWDHGLAEVGYALASSYQSRGVMTSALSLLVGDVFHHTSLERLEARCAVDNVASKRVLEKNGFCCEGILRSYFKLRGKRIDNYLFALLRHEYLGR
ncbi:MAG TPA: GNAT family N-acetyltransferase [Thermoanaerobaculia bacterium]|nr:GNAT family N-acetyltransferase [Thermoanaerobaculia bacterium]